MHLAASEPVDRTVRFGDHDIAFTESGSAGGASFVLVHGIGMGHRIFRELADELGRCGRVYALDLPGFGDSPEPARASTMAETGDLLAVFIRQLGIEGAVLVGHSMGTQVVVEAVARHPDVSDRIVLIAPTVNKTERTARKQAWRMLQDLTGESPRVMWIGARQYMKTGLRWFVQKLRVMLDHRIEDVLPRVQAETLVLRGSDDRVCPRAWVAEVTALLPRARMREIPERGHEAMITDPDPVAGMILEHARGGLAPVTACGQ